jgi:hypothetical protein
MMTSVNWFYVILLDFNAKILFLHFVCAVRSLPWCTRSGRWFIALTCCSLGSFMLRFDWSPAVVSVCRCRTPRKSGLRFSCSRSRCAAHFFPAAQIFRSSFWPSTPWRSPAVRASTAPDSDPRFDFAARSLSCRAQSLSLRQERAGRASPFLARFSFCRRTDFPSAAVTSRSRRQESAQVRG